MQIFKTTLFKTNQLFNTNINNKDSQRFVTEPIGNNEIPNHYYPAFKSNVEICEKMKQVSSKKVNLEELKKLFERLTDKAKEGFKSTLKNFGKFGITQDVLLVTFAKQPSLFHQSPDTIDARVKGLVDKFKDNGLTVDNYVKACVKQPPLFCLSPDTIETNVKGLVDKFKDNGLTVDNYVKACVKRPQLFCLSPDTLEANVKGLVEKFKDNGLTLDDYVKACVKQPSLFYQSSETIETNVKGLVDKFKENGLTVDDYIKACIKQPQLFCQSPDTIAEHIRAYMYIEKNKKGFIDENIMNTVLKKKLHYSTSLIYLKGIVEPQIKEQYPQIKNVEATGIKNKLKTLFEENPDMQFEIKILRDEMADNFIKVMHEFARKDLKAPNAFKIVEVPFGELK